MASLLGDAEFIWTRELPSIQVCILRAEKNQSSLDLSHEPSYWNQLVTNGDSIDN